MNLNDAGGIAVLFFVATWPLWLVAIAYRRQRSIRRVEDTIPPEQLLHFDEATPAEIEAALNTAAPTARKVLIVWLYALRRSEAHGLGRPVPMDIAIIQRRLVSFRPVFVVLRAAQLVLGAGAFGYVALVGIQRSETLLVVIAIVSFMALAAVIALSTDGLVHGLGRGGRAMRLVRAAADADPDIRTRMLDEAIHLDPEQGRARTKGYG